MLYRMWTEQLLASLHVDGDARYLFREASGKYGWEWGGRDTKVKRDIVEG
jgi:hypothetical protein